MVLAVFGLLTPLMGAIAQEVIDVWRCSTRRAWRWCAAR